MAPLFILASLLLSQPPSLSRWLAQNQWKHRIVLVYASSASDADYKRQLALLATDPTGMTDRHLLVRELPADQLSETDREYLQKSLATAGNTFRVLLIGKDGGVKIRQTSPITPKQLFSTIDGMYMRQQEMKKQGL